MAEENTGSVDDDAMEADFGAGFAGAEGKTKKSPLPVSDKSAADPQDHVAVEEPEIVKITRKDWDEVQAAARRTATYEHQFSKLHGTTGKIQQVLNELRTQTPRDLGVKLPDEAFTKMAKDFPELAELSREEFQAALAGLRAAGNQKPDPEAIKQVQIELETEDLDDAVPNWRTIVGAVDASKEKPDPNNAYRKWLATKDTAYQDRINGTIRAPVIQRSIELFRKETRAPLPVPAVKPRDDARAERIRAAVQPRGDGAVATSGKSEQDEFEEGFNSR